MTQKIQIAAYYFPNYHPDPRNAQVHGSGWTEWDVLKRAVPRFPGHNQPRIPAWGYADESDPQVMARKIDAAADHGINAFIFDWYWYDDGPFIERGLEQGFLDAPNNQRMSFAIMWANHNWLDMHPAKQIECLKGDQRLLYPGAVTPSTFETMTEYVIQRYFKHPAYWKINGAPYFSIYDIDRLVASFGSVDATCEALASFRARTRAAGFPDLHLNQVFWNTGILPGETELRDPAVLFQALGYDSITSYVWIHHVHLDTFPEYDYTQAFENYMQYWKKDVAKIDLPYFPNATMGWDSSPRTVQSDGFINAGYPFMPVLSGNTPQRFEHALRAIKSRLEASADHGPKILTINAWNEWTEGSYLEPDTQTGMQYLEAIHAVFPD